MKNWTKYLLRGAGFTGILSTILVSLNAFIFKPYERFTPYSNFYREKEDTIDLVAIGNSTMKYAFNPMEMWHNYGITSYSFNASPTHPEVICIAIKETVRLQSPKMFFIDLNGLTFQTKAQINNFVGDYVNEMPDCDERNALLEEYDEVSIKNTDNELFAHHNNFRDPNYLTGIFNKKEISRFYKGFYSDNEIQVQKEFTLDPSKTLPLPEDGTYFLNKILNVCDQYPNIKFIFGKLPRTLNKDIVDETYMLRSAIPTIEGHGYKYIEFESFNADMNLNRKTDQLDRHHLNLSGSIKFTNYFGNYLTTQYDIWDSIYSQDVIDDFNSEYQRYINNAIPEFNRENPSAKIS